MEQPLPQPAGPIAGQPTSSDIVSRPLDHLVLLVSDLDAAAKAIAGLGFTVSAEGRHPRLGTANRLIMFEGAYLELLGIERACSETLRYQDIISSRGFGVGLAIAGHANDARTDLVGLGFEVGQPVPFARPIDAKAGLDARFEIARLADGQLPGVFAFICDHKTPELVWDGTGNRHPNGVTGMATVILHCHEPASAAERFGRLFGCEAIRLAAGAWFVSGGDMVFHFRHGDRVDQSEAQVVALGFAQKGGRGAWVWHEMSAFPLALSVPEGADSLAYLEKRSH